MTFNDRLKIGFEFREFIEINDINIPLRMKTRRKLFIKWYLERYRYKSFDELLKELAYDVLYISEKTLENIVFNEK